MGAEPSDLRPAAGGFKRAAAALTPVGFTLPPRPRVFRDRPGCS